MRFLIHIIVFEISNMSADMDGSDTALLVCLQATAGKADLDGNRERQFFRHVIQLLNAHNEFEVEVEDWMITSYEVEFGPKIGFGGLCVLHFGGYRSIFSVLTIYFTAGRCTRVCGTRCRWRLKSSGQTVA